MKIMPCLLAVCAVITPAVLFAQAPSAPKAPTVRVGVMLPAAQMGPGSAAAAESVRRSIIGYLTGPTVQVVPLDAMLTVQAQAEAAQKECDFIVASGITQKKDSAGGRIGFIKGAASMSSAIPILGAAHGAVGAVTGAATGAALNGAAGAASYVKAKNEITFDYKLVSVKTGSEVLAGTPKAKAQQDGEDVIAPLIEQAAAAIVGEILKK
jgi:hypothetical protein